MAQVEIRKKEADSCTRLLELAAAPPALDPDPHPRADPPPAPPPAPPPPPTAADDSDRRSAGPAGSVRVLQMQPLPPPLVPSSSLRPLPPPLPLADAPPKAPPPATWSAKVAPEPAPPAAPAPEMVAEAVRSAGGGRAGLVRRRSVAGPGPGPGLQERASLRTVLERAVRVVRGPFQRVATSSGLEVS